MSLINKITDTLGLGKKEYVVQLYDTESRRWVDEGMSDEVTEPEEYGFDESDSDKRRKVCRKGNKVVEIGWVVGGKKKRTRKTKELGTKDKSPIDAISTQAQKIKRDQEKLVEIRDVIGDLLGNGLSDRDEEWMYPSMMTGLNKGLGHAFMTGMDTKKEDIADAGLQMVKGISDMMSAVPIVAVAIAKSQGVNIGIFGIDEKEIFGKGNGKSAPAPPPAKQSDIIHEHDGGFDVNTTEGEPIPDEEEELVDVDEEIMFEGEFEEEELVAEIPLVGDDQ